MTLEDPGRQDPTPDDAVVALIGARARRSLRAVLLLLLFVLPLMLIAMVAQHSRPAVVIVVAVLAAALGALALVQHRIPVVHTLVAITALLVACAALEGIAFGSVRTIGMLALFGAIVVAGVFLGRRALAATVGAGAAITAGLIGAQNRGWLPEPDYAVGFAQWVQLLVAMVAIALCLWFARTLLVDTVRRSRADETWRASVLRNAPGGLAIVSLHDKATHEVNAAYERILGWRREEVIGRTAGELRLWVDEAARAAFLERVARERRVGPFPARLRRADGEAIDAQIAGEVLELDGRQWLLVSIADVSAEVRERREREAIQARFETLFRANPTATVVQDVADSRLLLINIAAERLFRIEASQVLGEAPGDRFWVDRPAREAFRARLLRERRVHALPVRLRRADGEVFEALISAAVAEQAGRAEAVIAVVDLTEQLRLRAAQRASEERFEKAFESIPIGLTISRLADGTYLEANAANEAVLGYSRAELLALGGGDAALWAVAADRAAFQARLRTQGRVLDHGAAMRDKWGRRVDVRLDAVQVELDGEPCVLASMLNVTEQRRDAAQMMEIALGVSADTGEAFFRGLVEHLARATGADRVLVGELVEGGRRVRTIARFADGAQAPPLEYDLSGTPCDEVLARRRTLVWGREVASGFPGDAALAADGIQGYVGAPLIGVHGEPTGIMNMLSTRPLEHSERLVAVFSIFSARAQSELARLQREREVHALNESLELRVRQRTAQLEAANRELEAFSYSVSHDLRVPLRGVDGLAQLLDERHAAAWPEDARGWLRRLRAGTQRMDRIIEDLLSLARVSRSELKPVAVDLGRMAQSIADELGRADPARRVRWQIAEGLLVRADPGMAHIVLENLLGNAWKYTSRTADAAIRIEGSARDGDRVELCVADNGAGFDMSFASRLFQPFRRLHPAHEFDGIGVGLATVRRIVERHGGTVRAEGRVGEGARFFFSLPAAEG